MLMMPTHTHGGSLSLNLSLAAGAGVPPVGTPTTRGLWSEQEHEQFLQAMKLFPTGPWRSIAAYIGTRSIKQVQTHAQKYQQKINRRQRGLRKQKKKFVRPEHRVDVNATGCIQRVKAVVVPPGHGSPRSPSAFPQTSPHEFSFGQLLLADPPMLAMAPLMDSEDELLLPAGGIGSIDVDELLQDVEPLPFGTAPTHAHMLADDAYRQDVDEALDLLLA